MQKPKEVPYDLLLSTVPFGLPAELPKPEGCSLQGIYFRVSAKHPWRLIGRTRSVADAEHKARKLASEERRGRLVYLEARELPTDVWDLRGLVHRRLGGWLCKALLPGFTRETRGNRKVWKRRNERQLSLFG